MSGSRRTVPLRSLLRAPLQYGSGMAAQPDNPSDARYVRITDVQPNGQLGDNAASVPIAGNEKYLLESGDVLFARSGGTVGKSYLHEGNTRPHAFAGYLIRARLDTTKALPEFLYLFTQTSAYERWVRLAAQSGAQPNISAPAYGRLPVPAVSIATQREAITLWRAASRRIAATAELLRECERRRRVLGHELLSGRRLFPAFKGSRWRTVSTGDALAVVSRPVSWSDAEVYPLLSVRRRSGGTFLRERRRGIDIKGKALFRVEPNDFLISRMQVAHGALALVRPEHAGMYVSGTYDVLRSRDLAILDIRYFDFLSRLPSMYRRIRLACHGVHIEKMTFVLSEFLRIPITIPESLEEQRCIVACLETVDQEMRVHSDLLAMYQSQRRALMDRLLGGLEQA